MKKYLLNKITSFLLCIAGNDDGLKRELDEVGPMGIVAATSVISAACLAILILWVAL